MAIIFNQNRWIFVHIQKTGGSSVRQALASGADDPHKHRSADELRKLYGDDLWETCFKFSFVRNPWDRLVSWWSMIDAHRTAQAEGILRLNAFQSYVLSTASTFDQFVELCGAEIDDSDGVKSVWRNQVDYLSTDMDFIGRFERLQEDLNSIAPKLGYSRISLPHVNRSDHRHYTSFYTKHLADLVNTIYARDIRAFGYQFGE